MTDKRWKTKQLTGTFSEDDEANDEVEEKWNSNADEDGSQRVESIADFTGACHNGHRVVDQGNICIIPIFAIYRVLQHS